MLKTRPNADLSLSIDNKPLWNNPMQRRRGFHNLHKQNRYGLMFRSDQKLELFDRQDAMINKIQGVQNYIEHPAFSAMLVLREQDVLFEQYAEDFGPHQPHSIQSITKLHINLAMGFLVQHGLVDLGQTIEHYLPEIGTGYAGTSIQNVLDMNIENEYTEDYNDPYSSSYAHESIFGWRLPEKGDDHVSQFEFLAGINSENTVNLTGTVNYKSANTDVLGWIVERTSGRHLRRWILDAIEAAGLEDAFYCSTDVDGFPVVSGGGCMTARDLGRFGLLFTRRGNGVNGTTVGSASFINNTLSRDALYFDPPREQIRYSNQSFTNGRWIGHSGYGGQFLLADMHSGIVCVFLSVLENPSAYDLNYTAELIQMLERVASYS